MRTKLTITLMLGLMTFAFVFLHSETAEKTALPPVPQGDPFLIGGLHNAADVNFTYTNTLNFNLWHSYLSSEPLNGKRYPLGWVGSGAPNDRLFTTGPNYVSEVRGVITNINAHDNMKVLLQRPKIEYLCYGQRSDYQCEPKSLSHSKWFYAFNDHETGALYTEPNGDSAIFCTDGNTTNSGSWVHNPGFVCKRLKANTEQSHRETGDEAYRWDSQSDWLIKPRIRIDSVFANNPANLNTPVCSLTVKNQDGNTFKNVILRVRNFMVDNNNTSYNGRYLEEYFYPTQDTAKLTYTGDWGEKWWFKARGTRSLANESDTSINHSDIQVYWYGNCDMWLDYVRVDNDIAHNLFSEDPLNAQHQEFESWLEWEAKDIACYNTAATVNFYIELVEFNNLPCIKYVNERLNYYKTCQKQLNVITDLLCFYQSHISWNERGIIDTPEKIKDFYMDYTGRRKSF